MTSHELREQVQDIFRNVFDDPAIVITDQTTARDVEGWDSLAHINLIVAIEKRFGIKFATAEMSGLNAEGQNVGALLAMIKRKQS